MGITYTFAPDIAIPQLRGVTVSGGVFVRNLVAGKLVDQVAFATLIDGRRVTANVVGKPELEAALVAHTTAVKAAADAKRAVLESAIPGFVAWEPASTTYARASQAYDRASDRGYPAREAAVAEAAGVALQAVFIQFPATALWAKIVGYTEASNYSKSSAGDKAKAAVEAGLPIEDAIAKMDADWHRAATRAVDNS